MNVNTYFTVKLKSLRGINNQLMKIRDRFRDKLAIVHNFALIFVIVQLCFLYFIAGIYQIMGEQWMNGTAIYYTMQVDSYSTGFLPEFLLNNSLFLVVFAYLSIMVKLTFPFSLLNRYAKYVALFGIVAFHLGIVVQMGLISFSAIMISVDTILINDKEYTRLLFKLRDLKNKVFSIFNGQETKMLRRDIK